jgi:hypothetical protein
MLRRNAMKAQDVDGNMLKRVQGNMTNRKTVAEEGKPKRIVKPSYPFCPEDSSLLDSGRALASAYKVSFNKLLSLLLENAVEEWIVPYMQPRPRVGEEASSPSNEGVYPEQKP